MTHKTAPSNVLITTIQHAKIAFPAKNSYNLKCKVKGTDNLLICNVERLQTAQLSSWCSRGTCSVVWYTNCGPQNMTVDQNVVQP